jgi:hypothetical protein
MTTRQRTGTRNEHIARHVGSRRHGSAYLIALATMVIGLFLGLALLTAGSAAVRTERITHSRQVLQNAAGGGLEFGYWTYKYAGGEGGPAELPVVTNTTVGGCAVQVQVEDNTEEAPETIRVTAVAARDGKRLSLTRVYPARELTDVFDYAFAANSDDKQKSPVVCGTDPEGNGDAYVNGSVDWKDPASAVYGRIYAKKNINDDLYAWAKYAGQPPIFFPEIDLVYYQAGAHVVYTSSTTLVDPTFASPFELVYVNGDLSIQGTVSGTGTIVVDGTVTVEGDLVCSGSDVIALIAVDDILIEEPAETINAIVYGGTHGKIKLRDSSTELKLLGGVLAGDGVDSKRPLHVTHATYLDDDAKEALHLPGHTS